MGNPEPVHYYTVAEYLEMEELAECRSEYFDGEIFAMAGGSADHDRLSSELDRLIGTAMIGRPCETFTANMKIRIQGSSAFFYPDLSVVCGKPQFDDPKQHVITNPVIIIEVLSESTEARDRGKKFERYKQITSFQEYVLVYQTEPKAQVYRKVQEGIWTQYTYSGMDAVMELQSIGIQIKLADIYRRVEFA